MCNYNMQPWNTSIDEGKPERVSIYNDILSVASVR